MEKVEPLKIWELLTESGRVSTYYYVNIRTQKRDVVVLFCFLTILYQFIQEMRPIFIILFGLFICFKSLMHQFDTRLVILDFFQFPCYNWSRKIGLVRIFPRIGNFLIWNKFDNNPFVSVALSVFIIFVFTKTELHSSSYLRFQNSLIWEPICQFIWISNSFENNFWRSVNDYAFVYFYCFLINTICKL